MEFKKQNRQTKKKRDEHKTRLLTIENREVTREEVGGGKVKTGDGH